jgi:hypothetical protein
MASELGLATLGNRCEYLLFVPGRGRASDPHGRASSLNISAARGGEHNMRILPLLAVATSGIACTPTPSVMGTSRLSPSSAFTITSLRSRDWFGNDWVWTDIYVHHSASDSEYVGTLEGSRVDAAARSVRGGAGWAISNDGLSIVFAHAAYLASGHRKLERGLYQYVSGAGLKRLAPSLSYGADAGYAGPMALPLPSDVMHLSGIDTAWAVLAGTGEVIPMILLESSALHRAAFAGRTDECAALINGRANIDSVTRWGHTALDLAIIGGHTATVARLLDLGALPSAGTPALPLAVSLSRTPMVDAMLQRGLSANATDAQGNTLLHLAVNTLMRDARVTGLIARIQMPRPLIENDVTAKLVSLLLDRGADPNLRDAAGKTALDIVTAALQPEPPLSAEQRIRLQQQRSLLGYDSSPDSGPADRERYKMARQKYLAGLQTLLKSRH